MEIQFLGHSSFRIKGKDLIVVTDPFNPQVVGLKFPKTFADIITISHQHSDHNWSEGVKGTRRRPNPFVIEGPGEYEIGGVKIFGISSFHDGVGGKKRGKNTIYVIHMDGLKLTHLGDLGHKLLDTQLEEIEGSDILFIPVGGEFTLDAEKAVEVVFQIEPKIIVPMHYQLPYLSFKLAPLENFLKLMNGEGVKFLPKLLINKESLPAEREVVVINARS